LFWTDHAQSVAQPIRAAIDHDVPTAAYIGAANGDDPAFFGIFEAAMDLASVRERHMIHADFVPTGLAALESADVSLPAGGGSHSRQAVRASCFLTIVDCDSVNTR
jgi:hypothetical protein